MLLYAMADLEGMEGEALRDVVVLLWRPSSHAGVCKCRLARHEEVSILRRGCSFVWPVAACCSLLCQVSKTWRARHSGMWLVFCGAHLCMLLLVISYQVSVISYQLSVKSYQSVVQRLQLNSSYEL